MLLMVPILPVQLIAFDPVSGCRLNGVVAESDQVEPRLVGFIGRLRLNLRRWRILLLVLGLLLRWRRSLIPVIRLWGGRRVVVVAAIVSIRIVAVSVGIVRVPISWVAIVIGVAAESKVKARPPVRPIAAIVAAAESIPVSTTVTAHAAPTEAANGSAPKTAPNAATTEAAPSAATTKTTTNAAAAPAGESASPSVTAAATLTVSGGDEPRKAQRSEERDLGKFHDDTAFYDSIRCVAPDLGSSVS